MEKEPVYPAKIHRPIFRKVLHRERLYRILDDFCTAPIVWVSGPAGAGKTTLLSSYVDKHQIPSIWYQIDESDEDLATFFHYLQLGLQMFTGEKASIPRFIPSCYRNLTSFTHDYFEEFFESLPSGFLLVLDNFPDEPDTQLMEVIMNAVDRLPHGNRIVLMSRSELPHTLSSLRLKKQVNYIRGRDMKLNHQEFLDVARMLGVHGVALRLLETMFHRFEGWFAGMMIIAEALKRVHIEPALLQTARNDIEKAEGEVVFEIFEFFTGEVWENTDHNLKDFLIKTSFLPQMTVKEAQALTGYEHVSQTLEYLSRRNIFTTRTKQKPAVYQYHRLFREFLQEKAVEVFTPEQFSRIKLQTAGILEDSGYHEQAAILFKEVGAWINLKELIIREAPGMLRKGRNQLLASWIKALPDSQREYDQGIIYLYGQCLLPFEPLESKLLFLKAMDLAVTSDDDRLAYLAWAQAVESVVYESNDYDQLNSLIGKRQELEEKFSGFAMPVVEAEVATAMLTAIMLSGSRHEDFDHWAQKAIKLNKECGNTERLTLACVVMALRHHYHGHQSDMAYITETYLQTGDEIDYSPALTAVVLYVNALEAWVTGEMERSLSLVKRGLESANISNIHSWDMQILGQGVLTAISCRNLKLADEYLLKMKQRLGQTPKNGQSLYYYFQSYRDFQDGEYSLALSHAEASLEIKKQVGNRILIARNILALAEIHCALGQKREAEKYLASAKKLARETRSTLLEFLNSLLEAHIALGSEQRGKAEKLLKKALETGSNRNILFFWWLNRNSLASLMSFALEEKIQVEYVQRLIRAHNLMYADQLPLLESWPWPVKIYTLGRLEIVVNGQKIQFSGKSKERPMDLLKALIAYGGRKVASDNLMEALWPDSDGVTGQQALATTLHRLRRIIDVPEAILQTHGQVSLNPHICWVDVWAVERALGQIEPRFEKRHHGDDECSGFLSGANKCLDLYRGHFLSTDGHEPWVITPRERLRSKYIRAIKTYCFHLEAMGEDQKAIYWYQKAIELENLAEELYQGLIKCYLRLGRPADAMTTYKRCREVFELVLGVAPSEETERLRKKIASD